MKNKSRFITRILEFYYKHLSELVIIPVQVKFRVISSILSRIRANYYKFSGNLLKFEPELFDST